MKTCFSCDRPLEAGVRPGRGDTCRFCGADVLVCLNCRFYDKNAGNECGEPQAERVLDKERANFCEYFEFRDASAGKKSDSLDKLKALFKE